MESAGNASFAASAASASRSREHARVKYREIYAEGKYRRFMMMSHQILSGRVKNIFPSSGESHSDSLSSTPESLTDYDWETKKKTLSICLFLISRILRCCTMLSTVSLFLNFVFFSLEVWTLGWNEFIVTISICLVETGCVRACYFSFFGNFLQAAKMRHEVDTREFHDWAQRIV